jgi:class 3 adenylate cyclase
MFSQEIIQTHAPVDWSTEMTLERLNDLAGAGRAVRMVVLAADIRSSTSLMKESMNFQAFANAIGGFATNVGKVIRKQRGWFDKFTGDGFLAYWLLDERPLSTYSEEVLLTAGRIMSVFRDLAAPQLRKSSHNFPARAGISVGVDAGPGYLANVAGDLTILGLPVVGAVRMVSAAEPYQAIANVSLGEELLNEKHVLSSVDASIARAIRATKEYPHGQVVYEIKYDPDAWGAEESEGAG